MTAEGISPKTDTIEGHPFYVTEDGKSKAAMDVFA